MATVTSDWREALPDGCRGGAVTVGNFDGAHRGHAALFDELRRQARAAAGPAVAVTFDPHPLTLLRPGQPLSLLTTLRDRTVLLHELGAEEVVVLRTSPELLALSATGFFEQVLRGRFEARAVVEGGNFRFGHNREGTVEALARMCEEAGIACVVVPPLLRGGREVSSSRVRAALLGGDVAVVADLLGRPYRLHGVVGEGRRRGRTLGFPTANLVHLETLAPGDGVYAGRARVADGAVWPAAVNVGANPTFAEDERKVEAHLLGFSGDLYGQPLALDFVARLRDTRPFAGPDDLIEQLRRDAELARSASEG
jgi:riboflavin kinase/FMN adenylyltransferase